LLDALHARNQLKAGTQPVPTYTPSSTNVLDPDMDIRNPGTDAHDPDTDVCDPGMDICYPGTDIRDPDTDIRDPDTSIRTNPQIKDNKKHPIRNKEENAKEISVRKIRSVD
jgi:hypothetical protein